MKSKLILTSLILAAFGANLNAEGCIRIGYLKSADSDDKILSIKASKLVEKCEVHNSLQFGIYKQPTNDEMGAKGVLEIWKNR